MVAIDASTPAVATNAGITATTASFTPPANSKLVIGWSGNSDSLNPPGNPTITDNLGVHLTYVLSDFASHIDSPQVSGMAAVWTADVGTSAAMTVSVTSPENPNGAGTQLKVWVVTDAGGTPTVGAHGKVASSSQGSIAQNYTAQATGSLGFIAVNDWDATTAMTAGTGMTSDGSAVNNGVTYAFMRRTTADGVNGNTNTLNVTRSVTSTNIHWCYVEILPAGGGGGATADGGAAHFSQYGLPGPGVRPFQSPTMWQFAYDWDTSLTSTVISANINQVVETSTVGTLTSSKSTTINQVTESSTARTLSASRSFPISRVTTTEAARSGFAITRSATLNRVAVTETARTVTSSKVAPASGRVTVAESARPVTARKAVAIGRVTETSLARPATRQKTASLARVVSTETARALARTKTVFLGRVTETATAQTLTVQGTTNFPISRVSTAETARAVTSVKVRSILRVTEVNTARTATAVKAKLLQRVVTTEAARAVTARKATVTGRVTEANTARALTRVKQANVGRVGTTEVARTATARKLVSVGRVVEVSLARTVTVTIGTAGPAEVWGVDMGLM